MFCLMLMSISYKFKIFNHTSNTYKKITLHIKRHYFLDCSKLRGSCGTGGGGAGGCAPGGGGVVGAGPAEGVAGSPCFGRGGPGAGEGEPGPGDPGCGPGCCSVGGGGFGDRRCRGGECVPAFGGGCVGGDGAGDLYDFVSSAMINIKLMPGGWQHLSDNEVMFCFNVSTGKTVYLPQHSFCSGFQQSSLF